jgi:hypothetical protein
MGRLLNKIAATAGNILRGLNLVEQISLGQTSEIVELKVKKDDS